MNTSIFVVGSTKTFTVIATRNGAPWDLTGGSVTLKVTDPTGTTTTIAATISYNSATANWTVATPIGEWQRTWTLTDATGRVEVVQAIAFSVETSPR